MNNPFRENLGDRQTPVPCTIIIFGATGDLTHRKLIPALYNLAVDGDLPPGLKVIAFARREKSDEQYRAELEESNQKNSRSGHDATVWEKFAENIHYHCSEFQDAAGYQTLHQRLVELDKSQGRQGCWLFYLASAPEYFDDILLQLREAGLSNPSAGWARVIVEKPFGTDLDSARTLNSVVNRTFKECDTYRIDHYLGKETAQNIMVLRFANAIFEPLWNSQHIDHVQITCAEHLGMEGGRGGYYDKAGALRDMVQNHLLQLLSLVAMEAPTDLSADGVRDEKVKVLRSLRPITEAEIADRVVRAQYSAGAINGEPVPGYRQEDRVEPDSMTESYVALTCFVDTWRWSGVPFYIRMGKRLPKKATEISIHFKNPPEVPFAGLGLKGRRNVLVIRIQPDEGIALRMLSKMPGTQLRVESVKMDFHYSTSFGKASPEAYERLLLDAMIGDATLFARSDEVENAWAFIDPIEHAWHNSRNPPIMAEFPAGSWGPVEADLMLAAHGHTWRRP